MDNEEKVSYTPSQRKRFEISHDPISRERLTALTTTVRELRKKYLFVAGAVLFRSLSKGKELNRDTASKSDIDLVIYLDTNELRRNYDAFEQARDNERFNEIEEIDKELHEHYDSRSEHELTVSYIQDMTEDMFKSNLPTENQRPRSVGFEVKPISLTGDYSIYETLRRIFRGHNLENFVDAESNDLELLHYSGVALPWALDIGGGLAKYRKAYFGYKT